jgi:hypothetical protein
MPTKIKATLYRPIAYPVARTGRDPDNRPVRFRPVALTNQLLMGKTAKRIRQLRDQLAGQQRDIFAESEAERLADCERRAADQQHNQPANDCFADGSPEKRQPKKVGGLRREWTKTVARNEERGFRPNLTVSGFVPEQVRRMTVAELATAHNTAYVQKMRKQTA